MYKKIVKGPRLPLTDSGVAREPRVVLRRGVRESVVKKKRRKKRCGAERVVYSAR